MLPKSRLLMIVRAFVSLSMVLVLAQCASPDTTPSPQTICEKVLTSVESGLSAKPGCGEIAADQACYANHMLNAEYLKAEMSAQMPFAAPGNLAQVGELKKITSISGDLEKKQWGVAMIKVYPVNVRGRGGVPVTFVVYGSAKLENYTPASANASTSSDAASLSQMSAFTISNEYTANPAALCNNYDSPDALPEGAVLIDSPSGPEIKSVKFRVNGADLTIASALIIYATSQQMTIVVLEGTVTVSVFGQQQTAASFQEITVPLLNGLANASPSSPQPANTRRLALNAVCRIAKKANMTFACKTSAPAVAIAATVTSTPIDTPTDVPIPTNTQVPPSLPTSCRNHPVPSKFSIGIKGTNKEGADNLINSKPASRSRDSTSKRLGVIRVGDIFDILDGPVCNHDIMWWKVNNGGIVGWTGESDNKGRWLEPYIVTIAAGSSGQSGSSASSSQSGSGSVAQSGSGDVVKEPPKEEPLPTTCLKAKLQINDYARVRSGLTLGIHPKPDASSQHIGWLKGGDVFRVVGGPQCVGNWLWWEVITNDGKTTGWTIESDGNGYLVDKAVAPE